MLDRSLKNTEKDQDPAAIKVAEEKLKYQLSCET